MTAPAPDLVIFDCDGVLVDSERIANRVLANWLTELGLPTTLDESITKYMGRSQTAVLAEVETALGRRIPADLVARYEVARRGALENEMRPVPGVGAVIAAAPHRCVASSGAPRVIRHSLEIAGLRAFFDERIFSAVDVPRGKPHPDLFLSASRGCGVSPEHCWVIEDSVPGVLAAVSAGMTAIGFADLVPAHLLAEAGATPYESMAEIERVLIEA